MDIITHFPIRFDKNNIAEICPNCQRWYPIGNLPEGFCVRHYEDGLKDSPLNSENWEYMNYNEMLEGADEQFEITPDNFGPHIPYNEEEFDPEEDPDWKDKVEFCCDSFLPHKKAFHRSMENFSGLFLFEVDDYIVFGYSNISYVIYKKSIKKRCRPFLNVIILSFSCNSYSTIEDFFKDKGIKVPTKEYVDNLILNSEKENK